MKRLTTVLFLSFVTLTFQPAVAMVAAIPIGWWRAEGNVLDSGGTNDGVLVGGIVFTTGVEGQAFSLDGVDDEIQIPNSPDFAFTNAVSVSGWLITSGVNAFAGLVDKFTQAAETTGFQVSMSGDNGFPPNRSGILRSDLGVGTTYRTAYNQRRVDDGTPHHFALTYDGRQAMLYVDAVPGEPVSVTNWVAANTETLLLGADSAVSGRHFKGLLDEIAIYSRALTAAEVQELFEAVSPRLRIARAGSGFATISWSSAAMGFRLQAQNPFASPPWGDAESGTNNPVTVPTEGNQYFFRLIKP